MKIKRPLRFCFMVTACVFVFVGSLCAQQSGPKNERGKFIQNFDKNNDEQVSKEEFPGPDKAFEHHDKNQDGYIDTSEAPKGPPPRKRKDRY